MFIAKKSSNLNFKSIVLKLKSRKTKSEATVEKQVIEQELVEEKPKKFKKYKMQTTATESIEATE